MPAVSAPENTEPSADPAGYPSELTREVADDGLRYSVRGIRPADGARLVEFHRHLSPHSVYLRFFSPHPVLSEAEVQRFTSVDYVDRLALVAAVGDRLIGVGRFDRAPGTTDAEVAFVVADEYQHRGVGTVLLDELAGAARRRGVQTFRAETLAENRAMLDVFRHAGFALTTSSAFDTVTLRFPIAATDHYREALAAREERRQRRDGPA